MTEVNDYSQITLYLGAVSYEEAVNKGQAQMQAWAKDGYSPKSFAVYPDYNDGYRVELAASKGERPKPNFPSAMMETAN